MNIYFPSPTNHRNVLELHLFPAKGVAVVATYEGETNGGYARSVAYAMAIPSAPLDGSLDLNFPGLGSIVGTVTPDVPQTSAARAKVCRSNYPSEGAMFEGHLDFRGAGAPGGTGDGRQPKRRWKSSWPVGRNRKRKMGQTAYSVTSPNWDRF
ncbi:MAG TPA: hypothetical protein VHS74_04245 [Solirubrobacterales bacterium]|nr:hypothetical protein [Solirubrobacterales bacterium]